MESRMDIMEMRFNFVGWINVARNLV